MSPQNFLCKTNGELYYLYAQKDTTYLFRLMGIKNNFDFIPLEIFYSSYLIIDGDFSVFICNQFNCHGNKAFFNNYMKFATHHISCLYTCVVHEVFLDKSCFRLEVRNTVENKISWVPRKEIQMYWNKMKIKWPKHDQDQKQRGWFFKQVNIFRFEMATIFNDYDRELTFSRLKPASSFGEKF